MSSFLLTDEKRERVSEFSEFSGLSLALTSIPCLASLWQFSFYSSSEDDRANFPFINASPSTEQ